MAKQIDIQDSLSTVLGQYTKVSGSFNGNAETYFRGIVGKGVNGSQTTSNYYSSGSGTIAVFTYKFEFESLPQGATVTGLYCEVNGHAESTSNNNEYMCVQLRSGNTQLCNELNFKSIGTSNSTQTLRSTTIPTTSQLQDLVLYCRLGYYGGAINGATCYLQYSISGTAYEITSTLATNKVDSIDPAGYLEVMQGNEYSLKVYTDHFEDIMVEDNGVDVTNQLSLVHGQGETTTSTFIPSSFDSSSSSYDSVYNNNNPENGLTDHSSSTRACVYVEQIAYAEAKLVYDFDCSSIPENSTITSVTCIAGAACYSNGQYFNTRTLQLYSGSTAKGTAVTITGTGNTNTSHDINGGSWTREELDDAKIIVHVQRGNNTTQASFSFWGATLSVTYTLPAEDYYLYTLSNVSVDHTILISDSIIEIPDEDPQYNYYPLTISSINASTDPGRGTVRVVEGTNQTITIYPDDPTLTLATDNGADITSQLVQHGGDIPSPTVATLSGASYGFTMNNQTGYYTSDNKGVSKTAAVCRVSFDLPVRCLVTIQYINYAEATYDFGVFGDIDTALSTNYYSAGSGGSTITDSNYKLACNTSSYNSSSAQTLTYEISSGQHYIDIKYSKDDATDSNNDTLQWKITNIEALEPNDYYTYSLSNINDSHSLIFIFGDVTYYLVNSSGTNSRLYPSGSIVQLPGDSYRLTIVPDDYSYIVGITDNNVDRTAYLERKEEEVTKEGVTYTVVNYIYNLTNVQGAHNIIVTCSSQNSSLYIKINGSWVQANRVYVKTSGVWREESDPSSAFVSNVVYTKS